MENRFFITDVYAPAGTRTLERNLADLVRPYINHILSYDAMLRLAKSVCDEEVKLVSMNKRLKEVPISIDLEGDTYNGWKYFHIGQVSVQFRLVKGEII